MENGILIGKNVEKNLPDMPHNLITEKEMLTNVIFSLKIFI